MYPFGTDARMYVVWGIVSAIFLVTLGCNSGPRLHEVSGKVVLDDGSPLSTGEIVFTSEAYTGRAILAPDGSFKASLPDGLFKVFFLGTTIQEYDSKDPPEYLVPKKYTALESTDLTHEVEGPAKDVEISISEEQPA